ncbi:unnamed protein product [Cyclocybe aegerita]|uniref:Secreted protein n=1 Tax=Cyclocybe aegerita TaxID=1973307 RepID=A0A8S0WTB2_CYCAE|nr:unnamed protein product [Cyclocybe aegerita]
MKSRLLEENVLLLNSLFVFELVAFSLPPAPHETSLSHVPAQTLSIQVLPRCDPFVSEMNAVSQGSFYLINWQSAPTTTTTKKESELRRRLGHHFGSCCACRQH